MHTTIQSSRVIFVNDSNEEQGDPGAEENPNLVNQMRPMQWCLLVAVFAAISFFTISYRTLKRGRICFILGIQSHVVVTPTSSDLTIAIGSSQLLCKMKKKRRSHCSHRRSFLLLLLLFLPSSLSLSLSNPPTETPETQETYISH